MLEVSIELYLLFVLTISERRPVHALHSPIRSPAAHFHGIGVRHRKSVGNTDVIVPQIVKTKRDVSSAALYSPSEAVCDLLRMCPHDPASLGQRDCIDHKLREFNDAV